MQKIFNVILKIKDIFKSLVSPIELYIKSPNFRRNARYAKYYDKYKIKENVILYEAHHGKSLTCSPYAIFLELLNDKKYKNMIHVWSLENFELNKPIINEFKKFSNVKFIRRNSRKYLKCLASAKYLINNVTFLDYFIKKKEQIYINTWHGTPLKYLGKDVEANKLDYYKNATRNFLQSSYFLSPNSYTTNIFSQSYDLRDIYEGKIVEEGYPRNDLIINTDKQKLLQKLDNIGIKIDKKVILYAPTWRGEIGNAKDTVEEVFKKVGDIVRSCPKNYQVVLKVHSLVYKNLKNRDEVSNVTFIPDYIDPNELLSITDILITDYSSIFFDYLVTDRPIIFYMYDQEEYTKDRGMYLSFDKLPGPICNTQNELENCLNNIEVEMKKYNKNYIDLKGSLCKYDDGNNTRRIIDLVFNNNLNYNIINLCNKNKKKILFYSGNFKTNGVTTSILNLLDNIDYSLYDVSILLPHVKNKQNEINMLKINKNVRKVYRIPFRDFTLIENYREHFINKYGLNSKLSNFIYPGNHYFREFKRIFGNINFDYTIDYCGYSVFFANLLSSGNSKCKIIYQHSDMMKDSNRITGNKLLHKHSLNIIFSLYKKFDKIVSVSESSWIENKKNFEKYAPNSEFEYVNNPINYNNILKKCMESEIIKMPKLNYEIYKLFNGKYIIRTDKIAENNYIRIPSNTDKSRFEIIPFEEEKLNFVTVGRLSEEKDQNKLIRAFKEVNEVYPNTNLYIIGDGDRKDELLKLSKELKIENNVLFTGNLENPFAVVQYCDCFVLSSNYEGQALVIIEALTLGIPVISTDIPGPRSILTDNYGELVSNDIEGLIKGMKEFIRNKKVYKKFNYKNYNEIAMTSFYSHIN